MGRSFADLEKEKNKKFGVYTLEDSPVGDLEFKSYLDLPTASRRKTEKLLEEAQKMQKKAEELAEKGETGVSFDEFPNKLKAILGSVCANPKEWNSLAESLTPAWIVTIYEDWSKETQAGEAKQ